MILTVTPNPSIDLLFSAERLMWDDANRIDSPRRRPGGQGINLLRAARELGGEAVAVALLGGAAGAEIEAALAGEGAPLEAVRIAGETRVFVGVREAATSRSMLLNSRGPSVTPAEVDRLLAAVAAAADRHRPAWLACCGSLPPGAPADVYARMAPIAREYGAAFVVDCDGDALGLAAAAGCDLLTPNGHEAERLLGWDAGSIDGADCAAAAARAIGDGFGVRRVFVTLGVGGAVAADEGGAWHAVAETPVRGGSAVGAGDAFLAAALRALEEGATTVDALRSGVAAGTAVLRSRGSRLLAQRDHDDLYPKTSARRID